MNDVIEIAIALALLYVLYKVFVWIWKYIVVPTSKRLWKITIILATILFFMVIFVLRDAIFDILPKGVQILILLALGGYFGIKFLKAKNRL